MKGYAQKAKSLVLSKGQSLCNRLLKLNEQFPLADHLTECESLMKLPPRAALDPNVTIKDLQEQILFEIKLNRNYREFISSELSIPAFRSDDCLVETSRELI